MTGSRFEATVARLLGTGEEPVQCEDWDEASDLWAHVTRHVMHREFAFSSSPFELISEATRRCSTLRQYGQKLLVPRRISAMRGNPIRRGRSASFLDEDEFEGWLEQSHQRRLQIRPEYLPLPTLISNLNSFARFKEGVATGIAQCPVVNPLHEVPGPVGPFSQIVYRQLHSFLSDFRPTIARSRALASKRPMPMAIAAASVKTCLVGASDAGVTLACLARNGLRSTITTDCNTQSLLTTEDTLRSLVASKHLKSSSLRLRTAPFRFFVPRAPGEPRAVSSEGDDDVESNYDLIVWAPPVFPMLLPSPLLSDDELERRLGSSSNSASHRFDDEAMSRLRPSGGYIVALLSNTAHLMQRGDALFGAGCDLRSAVKECLPRTEKSASIVYERYAPCPDAFDAAMRQELRTASSRRQLLGMEASAADPFTPTAWMPEAVQEALSTLSQRAALSMVAFHCAGTPDSPMHRRVDTESFLPRGLQVAGVGPEARQGPMMFHETFEYERYLPKSGPPNARHWSNVIPHFDFLDDDVTRSRHEVAERMRSQRQLVGGRQEWPYDAEKNILTPQTNVAQAVFRPLPANPRTLIDSEAAELHRLAEHRKLNADAAASLRSAGASRPSVSIETALSPLPHLFAEESKAQRRRKLQKKLLSSTAAVEHYMDRRVERSPEAKLSLLAELDRVISAEEKTVSSRRRRNGF